MVFPRLLPSDVFSSSVDVEEGSPWSCSASFWSLPPSCCNRNVFDFCCAFLSTTSLLIAEDVARAPLDLERSVVDDDLFGFNGISRMNSTDSYSPRIKPSRGGQSGCMQGLEMTMKCLGLWVKLQSCGASSRPGDETREEGEGEVSLSAEDEVNRRVTKSRGVVGPGNWAER